MAEKRFLANQKVYFFSHSTDYPESNPSHNDRCSYIFACVVSDLLDLEGEDFGDYYDGDYDDEEEETDPHPYVEVMKR